MTFIDFARSHGVEIDPSRLYPSDRIKRCGTVDKPKSTNGAYFYDGQRGWVFNWAGEAKVNWYNDPNAIPWTDEEKRAWKERRAKAASAQSQMYSRTAAKAQKILDSAEFKPHAYLQYKGFPDENGLVIEDKLLIPMRNVRTNNLQGYQEIFWDATERKYVKKMLAGMQAKNAVWKMGTAHSHETWLVEGYATGLSIYHATRSVGIQATVVVAFSASNLIRVASQYSKAFIFADNDESKTGEKAAIETGLPWTMADQVGWDANDLHTKKGLFHLVKKIMDCRKGMLVN